MNKSTVKGFSFVVACIISVVAMVVPYYTYERTGVIEISDSMKLINSTWGIVIVIIDIVSVLMVFTSLQTKCGIPAALNFAVSIPAIIMAELSMKRAAAGSAVTEIINGLDFMGMSEGKPVVEHGPGFILAIIAPILVVITGIMFAIERD